MRYIWLIPSLASSLVFALTTGHPSYLLFAGTSVLFALMMARSSSRKGEVSASDVRLTQIAGQWYLGSEAITKARLYLRPSFRRRLLLQLRARTRVPDFHSAATVLAGQPDRQPRLGLAVDQVDALGQSNCVELPWFDNPHTLIVGPTGSGKTVLLLRILQDCLRISGVRVWFFDFKNSELDALAEIKGENAPRLVACSSSDGVKLAQSWQDLLQSLNWNGVRPNRPAIVTEVVIVDELASALERPEYRERILELASQGRSAGVRLLCASQSTSGLPRALLANLMNRIVVGQPDQAELLMLSSRSESNTITKFVTQESISDHEPRWLRGRLLNPGRDFVFPQNS